MVKVVLFFSGTLLGGVISTFFLLMISYRMINLKNMRINKFSLYFELFDSWLYLKENNIAVEKYFVQNDIHNIAIYGAGKVARHLIAELKNSSINIAYLVDNNVKELLSFPIYPLAEQLPNVDCIVITATFDYENIKKKIKRITDIDVILIDDILYELTM